jgi:hypothetical protein
VAQTKAQESDASTEVATATSAEVTRKSADERKQLLAQTVQNQVAQGARVESQSDFNAVLVKGHRVNHVLHLILTFFTLGLWVFVWLGLVIFGGEKRATANVDEFGNVTVQRL